MPEPRIVFSNGNGGISVLTPNLSCGLTVEQIARKDIPAGVPYKIITTDDLPDRATREAWTADFSEPDGYGEKVE